MQTSPSISIAIIGSGGAGALTTGDSLLEAACAAGWHGLFTRTMGPQIRGGEAAALLRLAGQPVESLPDRYDLLIGIDWLNAARFGAEIKAGPKTLVISDPRGGDLPPMVAAAGPRVVEIPMKEMAKAIPDGRPNMIALGIAGRLLGFTVEQTFAPIAKRLVDKGPAAIEASLAGIKAGYDAAAGIDLGMQLAAPKPSTAPRWLLSGNEATALGAIRGGIRFAAAYPITPATDILEWLAPNLVKVGGALLQAEDELAAINMTLGASYGGTPAMTVTSGPGISLMGETLGLAVAAEIPAVIIDVMRAGPSTGIASKTEQSDVNIAIYGGHGDAPRVVLAPTSVADCLNTAEYAVYVAESLQTPVIVLSDQALGQARMVIDPTGARPKPLKRRTNGAPHGTPLFKRYAVDSDPITPMPIPGTPGYQWVAEGLTHNEVGLPASGAGMHAAQINKRARKLQRFDPGELWGETWGEGDTVLLTFGSSVGPARVAARRLAAAGQRVRVVALRVLSPLPMQAITRAIHGARRIIVIEQNHGAQLYRHLVGQKAIPPSAESVARPGPLPFRPSEVASYVM